MATTGTYSFNPSLGEIGLYAFNRCGVRNTALVQEHMESLRMAANLVCMDFSNKGVNLWQVELVTQPLTAGVATYAVDPSIVVILDAYITVANGDGTTTDRIILPVSRSEYASYPNKAQQGYPTTYWMDRLLNPSVTLWLVPDGSQASLNYYAAQQIQDASLTNGAQVDVPAVWMKAFTDALSAELALTWAPDRYGVLSAVADKSYAAAATQNEEIAQWYVSPIVAGYWRA